VTQQDIKEFGGLIGWYQKVGFRKATEEEIPKKPKGLIDKGVILIRPGGRDSGAGAP
jgi:hypothetical protein